MKFTEILISLFLGVNFYVFEIFLQSSCEDFTEILYMQLIVSSITSHRIPIQHNLLILKLIIRKSWFIFFNFKLNSLTDVLISMCNKLSHSKSLNIKPAFVSVTCLTDYMAVLLSPRCSWVLSWTQSQSSNNCDNSCPVCAFWLGSHFNHSVCMITKYISTKPFKSNSIIVVSEKSRITVADRRMNAPVFNLPEI